MLPREKAPSIIRYLADCYRADRRLGGVPDLFARRIEHRSILSGREALLHGELDRLPLVAEDYAKLARAAALHPKERSLLYFAFPVIARYRKGEEEGMLCAPLLMWPALLTEEPSEQDIVWLELLFDEQQVNLLPLGELVVGEPDASASLEGLLADLPRPPFGKDAMFDISRQLNVALPELDTSRLIEYPSLTSSEALLRAVREARSGGQGVCLPACGLVLVGNSIDTRGISHELGLLGADKEGIYSKPLLSVLTSPDQEPPRAGTDARQRRPSLPAILSEAQQKALHSASNYPVTLVVGPPGTGKSYTVAAIALERLCEGETVLLSARNSQAIDVLVDKIEAILGMPAPVLRVQSRSQARDIASHIEGLLHGQSPLMPGQSPADELALERELKSIDAYIETLEEQIARRAELEAKWGDIETRPGRGLTRFFRSIGQSLVARQIETLPEQWRLLELYESTLEARIRTIARLLRARLGSRIFHALAKNRHCLKLFVQALRARKSSRQKELFTHIDMPALIHALPLWATSFADAHRAVPFAPEIFDLVVVDEATQCDMATCLPVIDRGRRLVVTGDPRQLRHVSFLRSSHQKILLDRHDLPDDLESLNYRDKSLLDMVSDALQSQEQVVFLDEHFRSHPQLIDFSNKNFYRGALRIMTERPLLEQERRLFIRQVEGRRSRDGRNEVEAAALLEDLIALIQDESSLPDHRCHSIGVLSPFRDQVDLLQSAITERLSLTQIERHEIRVETAYGFQGEERDLMLLSLCLDPDSPTAAFRYLSRPDVFNVTVTRARSRQIVYCSLSPDQAVAAPLLRRYLEGALAAPSSRDYGLQDDPSLREVEGALRDIGYSVWPAYPVAGETVDLLVARGSSTVAVDLVGFPGPFGDAFELERCRISQRAGLRVFPLPYFAWRNDPRGCLSALGEWFGERAI